MGVGGQGIYCVSRMKRRPIDLSHCEPHRVEAITSTKKTIVQFLLWISPTSCFLVRGKEDE